MGNVEQLAEQLTGIFGARLKMVAAFGAGSQSCAVVDTLTVGDLDRCAALSAAWKRAGLDVPLLIVQDELARALDAFPLEFSEIIGTRRLITGADLFNQLTIAPDDLRRACEVQARGHLVHLREGYIEAAGDDGAVAGLVSASAVPFRALIANVARLDGSTVDSLMKKVDLTYQTKSFPDALRAAERLVEYVDRWSRK